MGIIYFFFSILLVCFWRPVSVMIY